MPNKTNWEKVRNLFGLLFNDLQPSKMAARPYAAETLKIQGFPKNTSNLQVVATWQEQE